jgi:hypothetical protein
MVSPHWLSCSAARKGLERPPGFKIGGLESEPCATALNTITVNVFINIQERKAAELSL